MKPTLALALWRARDIVRKLVIAPVVQGLVGVVWAACALPRRIWRSCPRSTAQMKVQAPVRPIPHAGHMDYG